MVNFKRRLIEIQGIMEEQKLDLVVYGAGPDFQYLTGSQREWRRGRDLISPADCVFIPQEGEPTLLLGTDFTGQRDSSWIKDIRFIEMFEDFQPTVNEILTDLVDDPTNVAIGEYTWGNMTLAIASSCKGARVRSAEGLLDHLRMIKEPEEIKKLRKVAKLTDNVMEKISEEIEEGKTMNEMKLAIEAVGRTMGADDISFPGVALFHKSGTEANESIFNYGWDQKLQQKTSIAFDVGFVLDGYCSDWGRSLYFGKAEDHITEAYRTVQTAVMETVDAIGEEVHKTNEIFPAIEKVCDREGFGEYLRARVSNGLVGHQIGIEVHEDPWLRPSENRELVDNMVFCVEPKLWHGGEYYLRVEDMILIKNGKARSLTEYDRERFQT